jgi:adenylosuccinate synthase
MNNPLAIYEELSPLYKITKADLLSLAKRQSEFIKKSGSSEQATAFLKKISELVTKVMDEIKEDAIAEIRKGNNFAHGVKMSVAGKTTYDYSNDPVWADLKAKMKEREDFLKSIKYFIDVLDEQTGEVTRVMQAGKKVSDYIKTEF